MNRGQTLVLALLVMNFLLGFLSLAVSRSERSSSALRLWSIGCLLYAFGLLVTQQRYLPTPVVAIIGNIMISWAPIYSVRAVLAHSRRQLNLKLAWNILALTCAVLITNNLFWNSALVNFTAPSVIACVLFVIGARNLLTAPPDDAGSAARFMAGVMLFAVMVWLLRAAFLFNVLDWAADHDVADLTVALFAIAQLVVSVALTMAIFWIEVRRMEASLTKVAFSDALTGLPNRRATMQRLQEEVARSTRTGRAVALMVLDLDHFKAVNDSRGHHVGDVVLRHAAETLGHAKREEDVLGRVGGEEFVLLLSDETAAAATSTAERLRATLEQSWCEADGHKVRVTFSGGIAMFPAEGHDWESLFALADKRLYAAKQAGRNKVVGPPVVAAESNTLETQTARHEAADFNVAAVQQPDGETAGR